MAEYLANLIQTLLMGETVDFEELSSDDDFEIDRISTYSQAGVLSGNEGLVVRLADGSEFQITIIQSR